MARLSLTRALLTATSVFLTVGAVQAQHQHDMPTASSLEEEYYRIETIPIPDGVVLEAGGLALLPDDRLAVSTRRGEIWILQNPYMRNGEQPHFSRFAHGLHEPLGLAYKDGAFYAVQRGELTRMRDLDGDDVADLYETVYAWPQSGNHHAFSFGPKILPDGRLWVTFGLDSPDQGMDRHSSQVPWRGWTALIGDDGTFEPIATGLKMTPGFGLNAEGDLFFSEHDGPWIASGYISHLEKGHFYGHPAGLKWKDLPGSPVEMDLTHLEMPSTGRPMYELAKDIPNWKLPAVWLPTGMIGSGTMDILPDTTGGRFGPFENQLFVGDHTYNNMARVFLEKVKGAYQGAVFPFRSGFLTGPVRQEWGRDGSMFVGMTDRGWSKGAEKPYGLQRLIWTGKVPFEIKAVRAMPDGFELEFTRPADPADLSRPSLYDIRSFTYKYHDEYASPVIDVEENPILGVQASDDGLRARLVVDNLRQYYVHEIRLRELKDRDGVPLLHGVSYYTLNNIPDGERLALSETVRPSRRRTDDGAETDVPAAMTAAHTTTLPASWTDGPNVSITIGTVPGLRFNLESFEVPAGSRVQLTLENEDDLLHNLVLTTPGAADEVGKAAMNMGLDGLENNYVPDLDQVLYYTEILQPREVQTIYFTAPEEPGAYPYICTFPGHYISMRGIMNVLPR